MDFLFHSSKKNQKRNLLKLKINTLDLFSKMNDAQRYLFANKLAELPEMSEYSQGTESYPQFAVRIAEMLQDQDRFNELYPLLKRLAIIKSLM
jgi:hypothetical protein